MFKKLLQLQFIVTLTLHMSSACVSKLISFPSSTESSTRAKNLQFQILVSFSFIFKFFKLSLDHTFIGESSNFCKTTCSRLICFEIFSLEIIFNARVKQEEAITEGFVLRVKSLLRRENLMKDLQSSVTFEFFTPRT